ncbi:FAD-binding and (Fe-S)-binding domain-containing protein [Miltoncostaea marina]|uniref:FAD-binding and (Fe-S)-binding domain-containing protein n=1 Tax=Miltoncostaea marina TaxID=2843215 RepID=UPI001C3E6C94|nr:FAD-binding and (Fe-S)-binding domain-containing protein [Miltoncostaea marina]
MDAFALVDQLRRTAAGEVRADAASRELYACDASLYRRRPAAVLRARSADDLDAAVAACRAAGAPLTVRGAGTSLAGQAVGRGLVVDTSLLDAVRIDPDAMTARVGPGVVLAHLDAAAARHGLAFGPDVASASRATLGGMIANNSAGARSVVHGLTADHVLALDVTLADGTRATLRRGGAAPAALEAARPLAAHATPRTLLRRVSGYALEALGGDEPDWPRVVCGSEGTLAVVRSALLRLVPRPAARGIALLGADSVEAAVDAALRALEDGPSAVEIMARGALGADAPVQLLVEHSGPPDEVAERVRRVRGARAVLDPREQEAVWAVRRAGIGRALGAVPAGPGDPRPLAFIEDPAVPPARLPELVGGVRRILDREGVDAVWYGHASVGCLHIRPRMDLRRPGAVPALRRIAEATADLVVALEGSLSGEHGDGRARGELLPRMYPPPTIAAFGALKRLLDAEGMLNPGIIVDPDPLDEGLRLVASPPRLPRRTAVSFAREGGLARAGEACNGNGACRARSGAMCPSYQALGDERHATRGRAVALRAALEGRLEAGLADDGLHEALELCLACKACAAECPAGVDMAALKVEALAHRHRARGVPLRARMLGHAHELLALGSGAPRLARRAAVAAGRLTGDAPPAPVRRWRPSASTGTPDVGATPAAADIVVMADTFTRYLEPSIGDAALRVLRAAGARAGVVDPGCCGRPLLSQGLVAQARSRARRALDRLAPHALAGRRIVVLEPSCWSMLVDDLPRLVPGDPRAAWVRDAAVTFERAVLDLGGPPLRDEAADADVVVHEHCHARALGGGEEGAAALGRLPGLRVRDSGAGCCGMAGAFGHLHPGLSRRIAEDRLAPAVRGADLAVAAGTSCREQIRRTTGRPAVHPAEHLLARLA